jgi:outer membrane receptor for ferrienterochelin and colicins
MAMRSRFILSLLLVLVTPPILLATGSIAGRVTAKEDTGGLAGATVVIQGTNRGTTTAPDGRYRIEDVPPGNYAVAFSLVGYRREVRYGIRVEDGKEAVVDVALTQAPVQTEQVVVTANKREQSLQDVPISISIMDATQIQQRNNLTVEDALRYVSGVNVTGGQVNIRGSSGYSRGAGSRVLMLLDGVPFITGDTGELNFESIPVGEIDRIEIVKGATSALYGSNALGGVINIITKPIPETPETYVRAYGGLYNKPSYPEWKWSTKNRFYNGQSVSHSAKAGNLGMVVSFSRLLNDAYRQNDYLRRYNFFLKMREDYSNAGALTLNFGMLYQYGGQFVYWRNLDSALIPPFLQKSDNVKSIRYYTSGQYNGVVARNFLISTRGIWYHNDWGYETINAVGRTESVSDEFDVESTGTLLLGDQHTMTFGLEARYDMVNADLFGLHRGGGLAIYGQDEFRLTRELTLTAGARFDFQSLELTNPAGQLNPKAAVLYAPTPGTSVRASFGRGFRVPSVAEAFTTAAVSNLAAVPNKNLKPERSYSYEVGISQALGNFGTFDAAAFQSDYWDLIEVGLDVSSSGLPVVQWRNVTRARVQGYETSLKLFPFNGNLLCNVGYTYVYPRDITANDILKYRPRHVFYADATLRLTPLFVGGDYRYVSRVENIDVELVNLGIIPDGDQRTPIHCANFRIGADFALGGTSLTATFNVNNALQYNYVELIANMAPPRTYVFSLEAKI